MARALVLIVVLAGVLRAQSPAPGGQTAGRLDEATVAQLQEWMRGGRYTSRQLTDAYLDRIEAIDHGGPALRAIIEINPDARRDSDALDQ